MTTLSLSLAALGVLLAGAALWDLAVRRVPNGLVVATAAVGGFSQLAARGPAGVGSGLGAALVVAVLLWGAWTSGRLGGGDLKLAVAASVAVGLGKLAVFLLAGAIAGGVLATLCYLGAARAARAEVRSVLAHAARGGALPAGSLATTTSGRPGVPYAVAIGLGAAFALGLGG